MTRRDFVVGALAGVLIGILSLPITSNLSLGGGLPFQLGVVVLLPILTLIGLLAANFLAKFFPIFWQLAKFAVIGGLNTFLDFAALNSLIFLSGVSSGSGYSLFKGISFTVAVVNSYFWNKKWTFDSQEREGGKEFVQFLVVSLVGFGINVGSASFIVNVLGGGWDISPNLLANLGALTATLLSLAWNFVGYKFVVFKK